MREGGKDGEGEGGRRYMPVREGESRGGRRRR